MPCDKNTPKRGRDWLIFNEGLQLLQFKRPKICQLLRGLKHSTDLRRIARLVLRSNFVRTLMHPGPRAWKTQLLGHKEHSSIQSGLGLKTSKFGHTNIGRNLVTGWPQVQVSFEVPPFNLQMRHHVACLGHQHYKLRYLVGPAEVPQKVRRRMNGGLRRHQKSSGNNVEV